MAGRALEYSFSNCLAKFDSCQEKKLTPGKVPSYLLRSSSRTRVSIDRTLGQRQRALKVINSNNHSRWRVELWNIASATAWLNSIVARKKNSPPGKCPPTSCALRLELVSL